MHLSKLNLNIKIEINKLFIFLINLDNVIIKLNVNLKKIEINKLFNFYKS